MYSILEMIQVGILDDHHIVLQGIETALADCSTINVQRSATTEEEILPHLPELDVLLLDINLNDADGVVLCKRFKKDFPELKIISLTSFSQVSFIKAMLRNGADGYLFKNVSSEELILAIETVQSNERYLGKEVNEALIQDGLQTKKRNSSFIPKLTRREKEVLSLIVDELTNQQMADKLFISLSTVETHRMNLCAKLGAKNTAGIVKNAIKFGLA